jgi:predicted esterase
MRSAAPLLALLACTLAAAAARAEPQRGAKSAPSEPKSWCAPEVSELSDHVCWFDGGAQADGRRTLVIYLHGAYAQTPGFAYMQERAMAFHAKRHSFTVLMPTGPSDGVGFVWPASAKDQKEKEPAILAGIARGRAELEKKQGRPFDETFVVGFSSGAYYASSLASRGALDVDGFIVLAGGAGWAVRPDAATKRAPVFVGVSAADTLSAAHSRGLAGALASASWPFKVEERNAGHTVDWTFMSHGISWLRERRGTTKSD